MLPIERLIQDRLNIIKEFKPLEKPTFDGDEDSYPFLVWNLYRRVCEAIQSFVILFENQQYCDSYIIAGHAYEVCATLSYLKDYKTEDEKQEKYHKYFSATVLGRLIANLEMDENLEKDISWIAFTKLLNLFYPFGKSIIKNKEKYEEVIKLLNYRKGPNKEKINLLNKNFRLMKVREYLDTFLDNTGHIDDKTLNRFYTKYCNFKHCNILAPGIFEESTSDDIIDDALYLMLVIIIYLKTSGMSPLIEPSLLWKKQR